VLSACKGNLHDKKDDSYKVVINRKRKNRANNHYNKER
tara:strand:- start:387 stop:500 length:114 start_codon:yes stop_codon:yes gene_type:complete